MKSWIVLLIWIIVTSLKGVLLYFAWNTLIVNTFNLTPVSMFDSIVFMLCLFGIMAKVKINDERKS